MGLGKDKGSSRINRYERQVTAIGFDTLERLAEVLDVPVAYLLAENAAMADAILEFSKASQRQQANLAVTIKALAEMPALGKVLGQMLQLPKADLKRVLGTLQSAVADEGK